MSKGQRLNRNGIFNSKYWYSNKNPFFASGFGLPNCTCYAFGRQYELLGEVPELPLGNAREWYDQVPDDCKGQEPKFGAVACYDDGNFGHVAVVEAILPNGDIVISQSAWSRKYNNPLADPLYFWTEVCKKSNNYVSDWCVAHGYVLQGFIYLPKSEDEEMDCKHQKKFNKIEEMPFWAKDTIQELVEMECLKGDEQGNLDLTRNMIRIIVILVRFIKKLLKK